MKNYLDSLRRHPNARLWLPRNLRYYLSGGGALVINHAGGLILGVVTTYLFTNYTSKETYASFGYALTILAVAALSALPGVDTAILHDTAKGHDGALPYGTTLRLRGSVLGVVGMLVWAGILWLSGRSGEATTIAACSLLVPLLYPFASVFSYLQGKQKFKEYAALSLAIEAVKTVVLAVVVVVLGLGGTPPIFLFFLAMGLSYWLLHRYYTLGIESRPGPEFQAVSRNLTGAAVLATIASQLDRLIIGTFFAATTMAGYNLAFTLTEPLRGFGTLAGKLLFPQVVKSDATAPLFLRKYGIGLGLLAAGLGGLVAIYWIGFPIIQPILFPGYDNATMMSRWLVVATAIAIFDIVASQALWGLKNLRAVYFTQVAFPIQRIVLLAIGGYWQGVTGILAGQVIHYALCALIIFALWANASWGRDKAARG
jgi:O-antigen/teichoic acid export membrane protein